MLGGTDMSSGMNAGLDMLLSNKTRPLARKTMILMTDGEWNMGYDPKIVAREAVGQGITIHVITFLGNTDSEEMSEVARITGGAYYHAANEDQLRAAFKELARLMPVVLTN